jgi:hypothetical protein
MNAHHDTLACHSSSDFRMMAAAAAAAAAATCSTAFFAQGSISSAGGGFAESVDAAGERREQYDDSIPPLHCTHLRIRSSLFM